ncbi:MAG: PepSY domain-containing protein, partial [Candidatus Berkiella sp.]
MKTATLVSIVLSSLIVMTAPLALADTTKSQPGQMMKVLDDLKDRGFTIIKKIEFADDKGTFKANALDTQGNDIEIQVNPVTGEMKKPTEGLGLSAREIAIKVQDAGFPNIAEISTQL